MVKRWYSKKQSCQAKEGLFQLGSTSANCAMTTKSAKTLCHCIKLCLYIIRMLNNYLIEVYNVDSIHNGPIFEPQNYAQRPQNEYLSTYSGSVTAINPPKLGTTAPGFVYIMGRLHDSLVEVFQCR